MIERIPIKSNPKLFDEAVAQMQTLLGEHLPWLDHVFGICEFLTDVKDNKKFTSANVYSGDQQYVQVMPCKELGNFCFFVLRDPQEFGRRDQSIVRSPISLIFWYDMRDVRPDADERNREAVKAEILGLIGSRRFPWFVPSRMYEKPEAVFSDFSYDHTVNQFLMSPYAGIRIDGVLTARVPCYIPQRAGDFNDDFNEDFDS